MAVLIVSVFALVAPSVSAQGVPVEPDSVINIISQAILQPIINFLGDTLLEITNVVIEVSQYNGFTNASVVVRGWVIVRDVVNMAFIAMMLYIAFSTMFGVDTHPIQTIVKLMLGAIVINFSRTIIGLGIDLSQVVMLTFVNGIKDSAGGNFVQLFQIQEVLSPTLGDGSSSSEILGVHFLAIAMLIIALFTMVVLLVFLVARIVYLWILTIMSPLAFFGYYAPVKSFNDIWGQWIKEFVKQLKSGPILAFFLWLALLTVQSTSGDILNNGANATADTSLLSGNVPVNIQTFVVGIVLILQGLKYAQAEGGDSYKMARSFADKGVSTATKYGKKGLGYLGRGGKKVGLGGLALGAAGVDALSGLRIKRNEKGKLGLSMSGTRISDQAIKMVHGAAELTGLDKASRDRRAAESKIAQMTRRGASKEDIAKEVGALRDSISAKQLRKYSPDQLSEMLDSGKLTGRDAEAAMIAIAKKGHSSLKGQGAGISERLNKVFGNNVPAGLESVVRNALVKDGKDEKGMVGYDDDAKEQIGQDKVIAKLAGNLVHASDIAKNGRGIGKRVGLTMHAKKMDDGTFKKTWSDSTAVGELLGINNAGYQEMVDDKNKDGKQRYKEEIKDISEGFQKALILANAEGDTVLSGQLTKKMGELGIAPQADANKIAEIEKKAYGAVNDQRVKAMKKGMSSQYALQGVSSTGMASGLSNFKDIQRALQSPEQAASFAKYVDRNAITSNSGVNDLSVSMFENLNAKAFADVAKQGTADNAFAVMQAAGGVAKLIDRSGGLTPLAEAQLTRQRDFISSSGLDTYAQADAMDKYRESMIKAATNAQEIYKNKSALLKELDAKATRALKEVASVATIPAALYMAPVATLVAGAAGTVGVGAVRGGISAVQATPGAIRAIPRAASNAWGSFKRSFGVT